MSIRVSLRGMLMLIWTDTLRRVYNVGFLAGRLNCFCLSWDVLYCYVFRNPLPRPFAGLKHFFVIVFTRFEKFRHMRANLYVNGSQIFRNLLQFWLPCLAILKVLNSRWIYAFLRSLHCCKYC